jgi:hypothetical protein
MPSAGRGAFAMLTGLRHQSDRRRHRERGTDVWDRSARALSQAPGEGASQRGSRRSRVTWLVAVSGLRSKAV